MAALPNSTVSAPAAAAAPSFESAGERIVNVLIDLQPDIRLSFSSHPTNVPEALQRWLDRS